MTTENFGEYSDMVSSIIKSSKIQVKDPAFLKFFQSSILILLLHFALLLGADDLTQWTHSRSFKLNTAFDGANVSGNVIGFPLLVRLTSATFNFTETRDSGQDLRFTKNNGAELSYQIERWDKANRIAEIWVKMDTIYGNNNTQSIRMYWGNTAAITKSNGVTVFDSANGFAGVYHISEGGVGMRFNAAGTRFNGLTTGYDNDESSEGIVGRCDSLDASNDIIDCGNIDITATKFTFSLWAKPSAFTNFGTFIGKGTNDIAAPWNVFRIGLNGSSPYKPQVNISSGTTSYAAASTQSLTLNQWAYITGTYDGSKLKVYVNGYGDSVSTTVNISSSTRNLYIGATSINVTSRVPGKYDEVRIERVARSADWIKLCYENQKANQKFLAVNDTSLKIPGPLSYLLNPAVYTIGSTISDNVCMNGSTVKIGESVVFGGSASGNSNTLFAQTAILNRTALLKSLSFNIQSAAGKVRLGIYDASGPWGGPGALKAQTQEFTAAIGWNTQDVITKVTLSPGTYWLAFLIDNSSMVYKWDRKNGTCRYYAYTFGALPGTFSTAPNSLNARASLYATLESGGGNANFTISPSLPAGLTFNTVDGSVRGTPSQVASQQPYKVKATNILGTDSVALIVTVNPPIPKPGPLQYTLSTATYTTGKVIPSNFCTNSGGAGTFSGSPSLPMGLSLNTTSGVITGTPTNASSQQDYKIKVTNISGSDSVNLTISVVTPVLEVLNSWGAYTDFYLNTTSTGAAISENVTNFPVLLRLNRGIFSDFGRVADDGSDIRFTKVNGTPLPYEIEHWKHVDAVGDSAEVWILIDTVFANKKDQFVRMYYNKSGVISKSSGADVFDTADGFAGVWHLNENASGSGSTRDRTVNNNNGTPVGTSSTEGQIGPAQLFTGGNDSIAIHDNATLEPLSVTLSCWVKPTVVLNAYGKFIAKGISEYPYASYALEVSAIGTDAQFQTARTDDKFYTTKAANVFSVGTWTYLTGSYDRSTGIERLYVNGSFVKADTNSVPIQYFTQNPYSLVFGAQSGGGNGFAGGVIDEAVLSSRVRSDDWIRLCYVNQKTDLLFRKVDFSAVSWTYPFRDTIVTHGDTLRIGWSVNDTSFSGSYSLSYSSDSGKSWLSVASTLTASKFDFIAPDLAMHNLRFRVIASGFITKDTVFSASRISVLGPARGMNVSPDTLTMFSGTSNNFTASASDSLGQALHKISAQWHLTDLAGSIDSNGLFVSERPDSGWVVADSGGMRDSAYVIVMVKLVLIDIKPDTFSITWDSLLQLTVVGYDSAGNVWPVAPRWNVKNGGIDNQLRFKASAQGGALIIASYKDLTDTIHGSVTSKKTRLSFSGGELMLDSTMILTYPPLTDTIDLTYTRFAIVPPPPGFANAFRISFELSRANYTFPSAVSLKILGNDSTGILRFYTRSQLNPDQWVYMQQAVTDTGFASKIYTYNLLPSMVGADTQPPSITIVRDTTPQIEGRSSNMQVTIKDNVTSPSISFSYHVGGDRLEQTSLTLRTSGTDTSFTVTIPGVFFTPRGLDYVVHASDNVNQKRQGGNIRVNVPFLRTTEFLQNDLYQLISLPMEPKISTVGSVLSDDLGPYDPHQWRIYTWKSDMREYKELDSSDVLRYGSAYWIRQRSAHALIDIDSCLSTETSFPSELTLAPGWNSFGVPFVFTVDWADIRSAMGADSSSVIGPYFWNGKNWDNPVDHTNLKPWAGYYVKNTSSGYIQLRIPATESKTTLTKQAVQNLTNMNWNIRVGLNANGTEEQNDIFGIGSTQLAYPSPPAPPVIGSDVVSGTFDNNEQHLMTDIRQHLGNGQCWTYTITGLHKGETAQVTWEGIPKTLAKTLTALVCDPQSLVAKNLFENSTYTFTSNNDGANKLLFIIGDSAFAKPLISGFRTTPDHFFLAQPSLNLNGRRIRFHYEIPVRAEGSEIVLMLYSLDGRLIRLIRNGPCLPGKYDAYWDGKDSRGHQISSMSIIVQLKAGTLFKGSRIFTTMH